MHAITFVQFQSKNQTALNIVLDKKSTTEANIKISLQESDYSSNVDKKVKDYSKKAEIKGFRKGKVPGTVIQNMFGKSILAEEINHLISHSLSEYIQKENIKIIGEPLPVEKSADAIDWETQKEFDFEFSIGMVDEFSLDTSSKNKVTRYLIKVDKKVIDETISNLQDQHATMTNPEVSEEGDSLFGSFMQLDSHQPEFKGLIDLPLLEKKYAKLFFGLKSGDSVTFDIEKTFKNEDLRAQVLGIDHSEATKITGKFEFTLKNVNRKAPAELNQELFDKLFGKDIVQDLAGFRDKIKESITHSYQHESVYLLERDIRNHLIKKTKIDTPNDFLKKWLLATNDKLVEEEIDNEFDSYLNELKWSLIRNKIIQNNDLKIERRDIDNKAKQVLAQQFGGEAIIEQLGDKMDEFVTSYLQGNDGQNYSNIQNQVISDKVYKFLRERFTINDKEISLDEFRKKASEHAS